MKRFLIDLSPLRASPAYARLVAGWLAAATGSQVMMVTVQLQVYDIVGASWAVGMVGLFALVPLVIVGLYSGAIVDRHDRRLVAWWSTWGLFGSGVAIAVQSFMGWRNVWVLYGLIAIQSAFFAVAGPTRSAIVPRLLPQQLWASANALMAAVWSIGPLVGPFLATFLISTVGFSGAYLVDAAALSVALWGIYGLPAMAPQGHSDGGTGSKSGLRSVQEGLAFLATRPILRGSFVVDLIAMIAAQPKVIFPAAAAIFLGGGNWTVALLTASAAVGAILAALFSGRIRHVRRQGVATVVAVAGWGVSIAALGLVLVVAGPQRPSEAGLLVWCAAAAMAAAGACDTVSMIFRQTIMQVETPDHLRGRLSGVFIVVVVGGPRLGDVLMGSAASVAGEQWAAIAGGVLCIVAVVGYSLRHRALVRYEADMTRS